jgi:hypothetical protein
MTNTPPEILNVSGSVGTVGDTVRPAQHRDTSGRYRTREPRLTGRLNQPEGKGGIDTVTGQWIPGVRDNSQLHDYERTHAIDSGQMRFEVPDYSAGVHPTRKSHAGSEHVQGLANLAMTCPFHTTGGRICNG